MYFDRNATQSAVKRQFSRWGGGSGGMHRRSNAAWVSPQAVSPDFTYVRSREGFNLPQLVDSPNRSSRSSYSRTARWQGNADLWAVAVRMQSAGRREPGPPPGELGRVGQGAPTGRTGPTSGRHSGPQGRGRFLAVRLHGAQARGPQRCERCLPLQCTDHAERGDSRREGATSEQGSFPPPACGGLCRPEVGVVWRAALSGWFAYP